MGESFHFSIAEANNISMAADPQFRTRFYYARVSAQSVRDALIEEKGYRDEDLPTRQTIGAMLNRMGYRLKKLKK